MKASDFIVILGSFFIITTSTVYGQEAKDSDLAKQPMNGQVSAYYNVEKPDSGADWQLRVQLQFLFPKK